jgi:hypothetical protein
MTHQTSGMARVKDPTNTFGEGVTWIEDTAEVGEEDMASLAPVLNGKVLDVDMARAFSRFVGVDHLDGGLVVLVKLCGANLCKTELSKDRAEVFGHLGRRDSGDKFSFC